MLLELSKERLKNYKSKINSTIWEIKEIYEKYHYYNNRICSGMQNKRHKKKLLLKITCEEFQIK